MDPQGDILPQPQAAPPGVDEEPIKRSKTPPNTSPFAGVPPTPPETEHTELEADGDTNTEIWQRQDIQSPPDRPAPAAPEFPQHSTTQQQQQQQPIYAETPAPTDMSALVQQQQHRDTESFRPAVEATAAATANLPPTPPLTRTTSMRSTSVGTQFTVTAPRASLSVIDGPLSPRPPTAATATTASTVSLREISKTGKQLGRTPIDYLIPNGSLKQPVSGYFHPTHDPTDLSCPDSMRDDDPTANPVAGIFGNLNFLLDSYLNILSSGGSIAVGTGYHPVARKLLERVEGIFARDLGVEGVGWADVLEYLRGGRQKPFLCVLPVRGILAQRGDEGTVVDGSEAPPTPTTTKELAESVVAGVKVKPAMTKVSQWLEEVEHVLQASDSACPTPLPPADDEEDSMVCEIIEGILRNNVEENQTKHFRRYLEDRPMIARMKKGLTRLYPDHDSNSITPPIVALYLLLHPEMTPLLAAIANITDQELELISSGRFDAFSDGSTNVVARDEEEELNVINSLDRRLWSVLEGLEDEIEELHTRALVVRRALKARKEGIVRKRPGGAASSRSASPAPVEVEEREDDWTHNVPTLHVPITPDDSASNITFNRRRRQERASKLKDERPVKKKGEKRFSFKEFAIKSGEFGPSTTIEEEKSEAGESGSGARKGRRKHRESSGSGSVVKEKKKDKEKKEKKKDGGSGESTKNRTRVTS